ncbi:MAG: bifunctional lysylphosphatidylglycerol flippase/synthetase MprF, partial [Gammaproteobacteria bacterium]|nr:bifunctional lysylphosphatidylglycerol flippase/synthetase MprF [Gammaproteobacteria bacterium]
WSLPVEVGKVVGICTVTFGLGVAGVIAVVSVIAPADVTAVIPVHPGTVRAVGITVLIALGLYTVFNGMRRTALEIQGVRLFLPGVRMTLIQFVLAIVDLAVASAVLYVLLPEDSGISYASFLGLYVVAMVAAIISHVPGGLGVFEAVLVVAAPGISADKLLASVLAYRALYYLLPLAIAAVLLVAHELGAQRGRFQRLSARSGGVIGSLAPRVLGTMVFVSGAILIFSGATPAVAPRLAALGKLVSFPVVELSHLMASMVGLGLLIVARGLYLRLDAAWRLTWGLLAVGVIASLLKGLDWEEAGVLAVVLLALVTGRGEFYRKASFTQLRFTPGWIGAIVLVVAGSLWLGLFSYKHVEYSGELWWQFALDGQAPRFLRASVLVVVAVASIGGIYLLRPARPEPGAPDAAVLERALPVVKASPSAEAWLALVGDKRLLFSESGNAFLMYGVQGSSWIAMGDPVGPEAAWEDLLWDYRALVDRHAGRPVFYQVDGTKLPYYLDLGLQALKLGEAGRVFLPEFSLKGSRRAELRQAQRHAQREQASFEVLPPAGVATILPELARISNDWLAHKNAAEKRFSVGYFTPDYVLRLPCAVVRRAGQLVAFANLWPAAGREELSVDLMRYAEAAPKGIMDYLFVELLLWAQVEGYRWFSFGMAPLSGLEEHPLAPVWHRVGGFAFRHGEHFYNFQGLRAYKEKFDPVWQPRYLVTHGGFSTARALRDVSLLIAGGVKGVLSR